MKIYLNLLPEEKKEEMRRKKTFLKIMSNEILFSVPIIAFFMILLTVNFSQRVRIDGLDTGSVPIGSQKDYKELESYEEKFGIINSNVSTIFKIQKSHLNWTDIFYKINAALSDDVYITAITINNYTVSLAGKARTRDDFLKFQESIRGEECFSAIKAPLSSLVAKENVVFQIDFTIKEECLKQTRS